MRTGGGGVRLRRKNGIVIPAPGPGFVFQMAVFWGLDVGLLDLNRDNEKECKEDPDFVVGIVGIMLSATSPWCARIGDVTKGERGIGV